LDNHASSLPAESLWLSSQTGFETINRLGSSRTPFLFVISYDKQKIFAKPLDSLESDICYKLEDWRNYPIQKRTKPYTLAKFPVDFAHYRHTIETVQEEIRSGNTYLLNLTFETPVETNLTLKEIFTWAQAKFKLYFKGEFICFSPERFVEIEGCTIATYPMKGTIDATLPNAKKAILHNEKEMAEHVMIVDLMRNDLGMVSTDVKVETFRYTDTIRAGNKPLLQVSSKITAKLPEDWHTHLGTILKTLTPAGSITGTPKKRTVEIINAVENYARGFYTGIFGIYNGTNLRSAVMIRFMEEREGKLYYKSGGGITIDSDARSEYEELIDKIYLPL